MAAVLLQIPYPLVHGRVRDGLTVAAVLAFCAASLTHAAIWRGPRFAFGLLAVAGGGGLAAEAVGVRTGLPFGSYRYAGSLGPRVLGVPVVVPLAWAMMAYPALLGGRRAAAGRDRPVTSPLVTAVTGGLVLATWDLFLDPQMVAAGQWRWQGGGPALNGIPLSNTAGWLAVGALLVAALGALPERRADPPPDDRLPFALLGWTYASSLLANVAFFGRPGVAVAGGLAMGAVLALIARPGGRPARRR